ncbi:hypothetical protein EYF80_034380 [Liparis tanakae]|uniref:Uncharacterized protein n=1 Tax=Liparis tanakae TaxID=230148 RepID=A0A4Z2GQC1_9TELE|nr:hypothetical protein EYF80_034380 [Liparis tanakae]
MATMGRPSSGLSWCCWSGGGEHCLGDAASESKDPTHPSTLSTTAAILLRQGGDGSDDSEERARAKWSVESSSLRNLWHLTMSTLMASVTRTSGVRMPVDSTMKWSRNLPSFTTFFRSSCRRNSLLQVSKRLFTTLATFLPEKGKEEKRLHSQI